MTTPQNQENKNYIRNLQPIYYIFKVCKDCLRSFKNG